MGKLITLIGTTGVGKTTIAHALEKTGSFTVGIEQHTERPFQSLFKSDTRYGLANQVDYLLLRAEQEKALRQSPLPGIVDGGLDQDFHGFTQLFHDHKMINQQEFELCARLYKFFRSYLPLPDLVIHLTASSEVILKRLANRQRINIATENDIHALDAYLKSWAKTLPADSYLAVDVTDVSPSCIEILPALITEIRNRIDDNSGSYEIDFIA